MQVGVEFDNNKFSSLKTSNTLFPPKREFFLTQPFLFSYDKQLKKDISVCLFFKNLATLDIWSLTHQFVHCHTFPLLMKALFTEFSPAHVCYCHPSSILHQYSK